MLKCLGVILCATVQPKTANFTGWKNYRFLPIVIFSISLLDQLSFYQSRSKATTLVLAVNI